MGIINCSPNSFYQPVLDLNAALRAAENMIQAGANIIDIGGEATNPQVSLEKESPTVEVEMQRIVPVVRAIKQRYKVVVSIDTSQPKVMLAALEAGADMINDQRALTLPGAAELAAHWKVPVVLMHWFHPPRVPGTSTKQALLARIQTELKSSIERCLQAGIQREKIWIDPGFGGGNYGKNTEENYYLLSHLEDIVKLGFPVLVGWSRKSMIGEALGGVGPAERLYGSLAAAALAMMKGASIIRTHDVKATQDVVKIFTRFTDQVGN